MEEKETAQGGQHNEAETSCKNLVYLILKKLVVSGILISDEDALKEARGNLQLPVR